MNRLAPSMTVVLALASVLAAAGVSGCSSPAPDPEGQAIYAAVAPRYLAYTDADAKLAESVKARRRRTIAWWAYHAGVTATAVAAPEPEEKIPAACPMPAPGPAPSTEAAK